MTETVNDELARFIDTYGFGETVLAELLCDRHPSDETALVCCGAGLEQELTYQELQEASARLAGAFAERGVGVGDRVAVLLPKSPELLITLVAIWRRGAVHVPLFTAFGPDAISYRVARSRASLVVTDGASRHNLDPIEMRVPVLWVDAKDTHEDFRFEEAVRSSAPLQAVSLGASDPFILMFTSGTTGHPKGVPVPVRALASLHSYMRHGLDVRPDDTPWNFADPGWGYGLYYGVVGTLLLGHTILWRTVPFDPGDFYATLIRYGITNIVGAPTVYRSLRAAGVPDGFRETHRLRAISSGGEPLNEELVKWSSAELGVAIRDHYGQSELGMVAYCSQHPQLATEPIAGSMGSPAPGVRLSILDPEGAEVSAGSAGELAVDTEHSSAYWFGGYSEDPDRTAERFPHGSRYYMTGDTARFDDAGRLFFASRADDVITSSGYRVGPFEIESALIAHPSVADVAVIGTPDEMRVEAVTAYVVPAPGVTPGPDLVQTLQLFVKARLARHLYPRRVVFLNELPRTSSGKVRRTELRIDWARRSTPLQPDSD